MRIATILLLAGVAGSAAGQGAPTSLPDSLDRIVRAQADSGFRGVVLVALGDSIVLHRAYGSGAPALDTGSTFWIASITKSFTAAAILELQHRRLLSVDDSLARFFPGAPADKRAITLRQLLTHTSGIRETDEGAGSADRQAAIGAILRQPLQYAPGKGYTYENSDYRVLAAVVEVVTHKPWQQAIRSALLDSIGLRHTGFWCDGSPRMPARKSRARGAPPCTQDWWHRGPDGMYSTAGDLLTWLNALDRTTTLRDIGQPKVKVRDEPPFEVHYGFGARVYTRDGKITEVLHAGSGDDGNSSIASRRAAGWTYIVLSDAGSHGRGTWASYMLQMLAPRP